MKTEREQTEQMIASEFAQMRKGVAILGLCAVVVLILCQQAPLEVLLGTSLGCVYALYNFWTICQSTMRALSTQREEMATKMAQGAYFKRYACTAVFIGAVLFVPYVHVGAAVLPLLFPHLIVLIKQTKYVEK